MPSRNRIPQRLGVLLLVLGAAGWLPAQAPKAKVPKGARGARVETPAPEGERRVALVIGNGAYAEAPLKNPGKDARAMAEALRDCGFEVQLLVDADRGKMVGALREFGNALKVGGGVGVFYFAGHGMQVKGRNFLIPIGADIASEDEVAFNTLDAEAVLAKMESAQNRMNLVILDACRNNPFARSFRSGSRGLAQMDAPSGSYLAFATSPGKTAADGSGSNGLYTKHLLAAMRKPGTKVEDVFKEVRNGVLEESGGEQVPWESSSLRGDFFFKPPAAVAPKPAPGLPPPPVVQGLGEAPPVAAMVGGLQVVANVADAQVYVDGELRGKAGPTQPLNLKDIPVGMVTVRVEAPGYRPETRSMEVQDGKWAQARLVLTKAAVATAPAEAKSLEAAAALKSGVEAEYEAAVNLFNGKGTTKDEAGAVKRFQALAQGGHPASALYLGWCFESGKGVTRDASQAVHWYKLSAEAGDVTAQGNLGYCYEKGIGTPVDYAEAVRWYRKAAEKGDGRGLNNLGWMHQKGLGMAKDEATAATWYRKSAEAGYAHGQFNYGWMLVHGLGVAKQEAAGVGWYRKAAEQGNASAQVSLGYCLETGTGLAKDPVAAAGWYRKAAEQGDGDAQANLGYCHEVGFGVLKDYQEAARWYRKGAAQNHGRSLNNLSILTRQGLGLAKDEAEAAKLARRSAEAGYAPGQSNLWWMLANGVGVTEDQVEATTWARKAAEQGDRMGQRGLGWAYECGKGIPVDLGEALRWYRKAADQGDPWAQLNLGGMLEDGRGTAKDLAGALVLYRKAAAQGNDPAKERLKKLGQPVS